MTYTKTNIIFVCGVILLIGIILVINIVINNENKKKELEGI